MYTCPLHGNFSSEKCPNCFVLWYEQPRYSSGQTLQQQRIDTENGERKMYESYCAAHDKVYHCDYGCVECVVGERKAEERKAEERKAEERKAEESKKILSKYACLTHGNSFSVNCSGCYARLYEMGRISREQSSQPQRIETENKKEDGIMDSLNIGLHSCLIYGNLFNGQCLACKATKERERTTGTNGGKTSEQRKSEPIYSGVLKYFPDAIAAVSRVSKAGNDKHNPGEPLHWSRGKSNDHLDCVTRHIITPEEIDPDSGELHLAHAAWRVLAALQLAEENKPRNTEKK